MSIPLFIDTDVLIDYLRGLPASVSFIQGLQDRPMLSAMTVAELYQGIRDGTERTNLEKLLSGATIVPLRISMAIQGGLFRRSYGKSHGVGLADALIAATVEEFGGNLATLNQKHYPMLANVLIPYTKP